MDDELRGALFDLHQAVCNHLGEGADFDPLKTIAEATSILRELPDSESMSPTPGPLATFDGRIVEVGTRERGDSSGDIVEKPTALLICDEYDARRAASILYRDCTFVARLRR